MISAAATGVVASAALTATAYATPTNGSASPTGRAQVRLPAPTGPYAVGATSLHLVDRSRPDPWRPAERRELMVSVFYPAEGVTGRPVAPQLAAGDAAGFDTFAGPGNYGVPPGTVDWAATYEDARIGAGVDLDGTLGFGDDPAHLEPSPVAQHGLDRPFPLMGSAGPGGSDHRTESSWRAFWAHTRGWRADLRLTGSRHGSYTDAGAILPQLRGRIPEETISEDIGTVDPARTVAAERAYVSSFFDRWLRHKDDGLLDHPSSRYPEIEFVP
ncbi:MAG: hypothetical protein ACJ72W_20610 [Actinoallomurus sp.]